MRKLICKVENEKLVERIRQPQNHCIEVPERVELLIVLYEANPNAQSNKE